MKTPKLIKEFKTGWSHFCDCLDFNHSALDAEAIRFMNEMPSKIIRALEASECESSE